METEKGRWFLAEYARRHRSADTALVLEAIGGLERVLKRERRPDIDRIRLDIGEMKDAIEQTKREIAQIKHSVPSADSRFTMASNELDAIVSQTETATGEILGAAEKIQELAWLMRDAGVDEQTCDTLETLTTTIYTACSFQDLTGQRTQKVVHVLRYLESRIDAMIEIWGLGDDTLRTVSPTTAHPDDARPDAHLLNGPALAGEGVDQSFVDHMMRFEAPEPDLAPVGAHVDHMTATVAHVAPAETDDMAADVVLTTPYVAASDAPADVFETSPIETAGNDGAEAAVPVENPSFLPAPAIDLPIDLDFSAADIDALAAELPSPLLGEITAIVQESPGDPQIDLGLVSSETEDAGGEEAEVLARAAEAMEQAIETLNKVTEAVGLDAAPTLAEDPLARLSRVERQALFS